MYLEYRMRHFTTLAVITLFLFGFTPISSADQDSFVVSGNPNAPPVVWEQYKNLVGLGPDLVATILGELGISYTVRLANNWEDVQKKARQGKIDLIISAYKNKEREEYLSFSIPYLAQPVVIVVEKGKEFDFSSWDALKGKKGVTNAGESYGQEFDEFIEKHLTVNYYQFERALQLLNRAEADYLIADLYTALIYARLLEGEDRITILDPPVTVQNFHLAVRSDSGLASHLPEINARLEELIKNGMVSKTLLKHFDKWKELSERRADYLAKGKAARSQEQQTYLKEQDEMARQRIIGIMVDTQGAPVSTQ